MSHDRVVKAVRKDFFLGCRWTKGLVIYSREYNIHTESPSELCVLTTYTSLEIRSFPNGHFLVSRVKSHGEAPSRNDILCCSVDHQKKDRQIIPSRGIQRRSCGLSPWISFRTAISATYRGPLSNQKKRKKEAASSQAVLCLPCNEAIILAARRQARRSCRRLFLFCLLFLLLCLLIFPRTPSSSTQHPHLVPFAQPASLRSGLPTTRPQPSTTHTD